MGNQSEFDFSLNGHRKRVLSLLDLPKMIHRDGTGCPGARLCNVLRYVNAHSQSSGGVCKAKHQTMAKNLGFKPRSISRWLDCLVDADLLISTGIGGQRKSYKICWPNLLDFVPSANESDLEAGSTLPEVALKTIAPESQGDLGADPRRPDDTSTLPEDTSTLPEVASFNQSSQSKPPPTKSAAAEILKGYFDNDDVRESLASRYATEIPHVVAEYEVNKTLFRSPGVIKYRLEKDCWPVDGVKSIEEVESQRAAEVAKRQREATEDAEREREAARSDELERDFGPKWDSMSQHDRESFAQSTLDPYSFGQWKKRPQLLRAALLETLAEATA